jgi:4a-hydroxytetrahydrobiopterin dehydratase
MKLAAPDEIERELSSVRQWRRDGDEIVRTFDCANFDGSIAFVNKVAAAANAAGHHPDIALSWNKVTLRLSTHSAGGLTALDFALAREIDALEVP